MILIFGTLTLAGLATGRLLGWMIHARRARARDAVTIDREPAPSPEPRPASTGHDHRLAGLPVNLGDVVVLAHGEEAWLAGAWLFRERAAQPDARGDFERTIAALFVAPDRGQDRAVYARPAPEPSLDWLTPLAPDALVVGSAPPSALEHDGERFERIRRLPVGVIVVGEGAVDVGRDAVVAEYEGSAGARLVVVVGARATRVFRGRRLEPGMFEVLPAAVEGTTT